MLKLRITAVLLLASALFLASCAGGTAVESETTTAAATPAETVTDAVTTAEETLPTLDVKSYAGEKFRVIWPEPHGDGHFMHDEINSATESGDIISDAVFKRNRRVEEVYGAEIESTLIWCSKISDQVTKTIASGSPEDVWDAFCAPIKMVTSAALEGKWTDWLSMPYYSAQMPWWDSRIMSRFAIAGKQFFGSGDIIYSDNFYPYCVFANLGKYGDYGFGETLFSMVENETWTLDRMMELCASVPVSSDDVWNYEDTYGILVNTSLAQAMLYASGQSLVAVNDAGEAEIVLTLEGAQNVLEKMVKLFHDGHIAYDTDEDIGHNIPGMTHAQTALSMYTSGLSLFYSEELIISERLTNAGSEINTGILPLPKFSSDSDGYVCLMNDSVVIGVPVNADPEKSSLILSAMSRESVDTLTPAFYNVVLTFRYANNAESVEMLDIILKSAIPQDIGTILGWGGVMSAFKNCVTVGSLDYAGKYASTIRTATNDARQFNRKIGNLGG